MKTRITAWLLCFLMIFTSINMDVYASDMSEEVFTAEIAGETFVPEDDSVTDEELYDGYVYALLYGGMPSTWSLRNQLTGTNLAAFHALKALIKKTAEGELASTAYSITAAELGLEQTSWTADELGVDSILVGSALTSDAAAALQEKVGIDLGALIYSLMADCPYELYWFDKVSGVIGPKYNGSATNTMISISSISFEFSVSQDYAAGQYQVDTSGISKVKTAVNNALDIVEKYASDSDYDKLDGYRGEICNLVSYNEDAAAGSTDYGDPWQVISVFDGDSSTNVVCEGYSKAFQYLCDLTSFEDENINCISVSGDINDGTGADPHMWNVVTMEDGKNYLVDVTNCDAGTVGADRQLFLAGYASGTLEGGYVYQCDAGQIRYCYDKAMSEVYESSEMIMASEDYTINPAATDITSIKAGGRNFTVNWKRGTGQISGYQIYYATASNFSNAKKFYIRSADTLSRKIKGLSEGTKYYVKVRTYKEVDGKKYYSAWSSVETVTPNPVSTSITSIKAGGRNFTVNWEEGTGQISGYQIYYATKSDFSNTKKLYIRSADTLSRKFRGLTEGTKYYVKVRTYKEVDGKKYYSAWSEIETVTPNPVSTSITSIKAGDGCFTVNWEEGYGQISGYQIYYATASDFSNTRKTYVKNADTLSRKITGLTERTKYYVKVRTYKEVESKKYFSAWSIVGSVNVE